MTEFSVIFNQQGAGDSLAGYKWENKAPTNTTSSVGPVEIVRLVKVQATNEEEAANGVRKAYGDAMVTGPMLVAESNKLKENTAK